MGRLDGVDAAGRQIAGLLGYNPGPGIYSRLERAVEGMPANVRVQEIPGLLKRYKEGVPGWELRATDLDSTIAGRDVVPRDELLAAVRERSPVYTHKEVVLGEGGPTFRSPGLTDEYWQRAEPTALPRDQMPAPSPLGAGGSHGQPVYGDYGQGGSNYTELLLVQPGAHAGEYGNHFRNAGATGAPDAVAHARFDTHGDALRINELQSDLGIHNRKTRESLAKVIAGGPVEYPPLELPFPLEDAWADLLIKRLALEAARKGHRAIEVASPRAIADKVGGNIENYEHFYGKVVPGAIERLGRRMGGGFSESAVGFDPEILRRVQGEIKPGAAHAAILEGASADYGRLLEKMSVGGRLDFPGHMRGPLDALAAAADTGVFELREANRFRDRLAEMIYAEHKLDPRATELTMEAARSAADQLMPSMMARAADRRAIEGPRMANADAQSRLWKLKKAGNPPYRYIMSDAMRRNLIEKGVGASVLAPLLMQGEGE